MNSFVSQMTIEGLIVTFLCICTLFALYTFAGYIDLSFSKAILLHLMYTFQRQSTVLKNLFDTIVSQCKVLLGQTYQANCGVTPGSHRIHIHVQSNVVEKCVEMGGSQNGRQLSDFSIFVLPSLYRVNP